MKQSSSAVRRAALAGGWRSGLEASIGAQLETADPGAKYEERKLAYVRPQEAATYTPDWVLSNDIVVESKGQFDSADRKKHRLLKAQHPNLDLRFVFFNPNARIGKKSSTRYRDWCDKFGFQWARRSVPQAWIDEPPTAARSAALQEATKK